MRDKILNVEPLKINIGCGGRPIAGFINIDMDSLEKLKIRYSKSPFHGEGQSPNFLYN